MLAAAGVARVKGMPYAFAVRASRISAAGRPALIPPVGAIASGSFDSTPKSFARVSTCATSTSTRGSSCTRSKAARFPRSVTSSSAARSAPDGYTLFMTTSGIQAINPALYAKMAFDPNKDLAPVAALVSLNNVLVVHPSVPARTVQDVIALAKKDPGKWTYASSGNGTSIHMSGAMFTQLTGTDILHIPYKGSGPAVTDLLAGQVNMMFDNIPSSLPHIKAGKLRALATTGAKRDPALPDLPTVAEAGVPGYESGVWFGLSVPAGPPPEGIVQLHAAALQAAKAPGIGRGHV